MDPDDYQMYDLNRQNEEITILINNPYSKSTSEIKVGLHMPVEAIAKKLKPIPGFTTLEEMNEDRISDPR